jgi:2-dehydropantoate 2-reductase
LRYLVFGSGAVGSYLGVQLALSGQPVSFLTRQHHLDWLRERGFTLTGVGSQKHLPHPSVYADFPQALAKEKPDLILITVKAYDLEGAVRTIGKLHDGTQAVVSFLNGLNNEARLAGELGENNVIPATLTTAVQMPEPGVIRAERVRGIGLSGNHKDLTRFHSELKAAGFLVRQYPDAERMKWSKLLTNIVSNATSAILGWSPKQVFDHPITAKLEIDALREAVLVMHRLGLRPHDLPRVRVGLLGQAIFLPTMLTRIILGQIVSKGRGEKKPSFHYDIGRGRSEIEWLNGAVVKYGAMLGINTPVNQALTETLLELVHRQCPHDAYLNQPEKLLERIPGKASL